MPSSARPLRVLAALLLVGGLWGSSFPLVRIAVPSLGAIGTTHARLAIGFAVLALVSSRSPAIWKAVSRQIGPFLLLATLNVAAPLTLVATSIAGLNASIAAVLNATTPLFAVAVAAVWLHQRITWVKALGVAVGLGGVAIVVGGAPIAIDTDAIPAVAASLAAALLYALGGVYARVRFAATPAMTVALGQQLAATLLMIPATAAVPPPGPITSTSLVAVAAIGVGATAVGYLVYFWIIRQAGPVVASTVTLLVPLSGTAISVAWLNEPLTAGFVIGTLVILLSVATLIWSSAQPTDDRASTDTAPAHQPTQQHDDHRPDATPARRADDGSH